MSVSNACDLHDFFNLFLNFVLLNRFLDIKHFITVTVTHIRANHTVEHLSGDKLITSSKCNVL